MLNSGNQIPQVNDPRQIPIVLNQAQIVYATEGNIGATGN